MEIRLPVNLYDAYAVGDVFRLNRELDVFDVVRPIYTFGFAAHAPR